MRLPPASWLLVALLLVIAAPPAVVRGDASGAGAPLLSRATTIDVIDVTITPGGAAPQVITITVGTTVQWRNNDSIAHTVTAGDSSFGPFPLGPLDVALHTFDAPGTYTYTVSALPPTIYSGMVVVMSSAQSATVTPSPTSSEAPTMTPTPSATPTMTPTDTATATFTSSPSATSTRGNMASATSTVAVGNTPTSTAVAPVVDIAIAGDPPALCAPTIPTGNIVQWSNTNAPGGLAYYLAGTSPASFAQSFGMVLAPGATGSWAFDVPGTFTYTVSSGGQVLVPAATIIVAPTAAPSSCPTPAGTATDSATPTASDTETAPSSTATPTGAANTGASPTLTGTPSPTSTPTATSTLSVTTTPTATPTPTHTSSATPSPSPSATPTLPPIFHIGLSGAVPSPCALSIPVGSVVTWTNENPLGGPTYYLRGVSPLSFSTFSARIDPGGSGQPSQTLPFPDAGTYTYSITSTAFTAAVKATILVGAVAQTCATTTSTSTDSATVSPSSTPTDLPSATPTASVTWTATSTPTPTMTPTATATTTWTPSPTNTAAPTDTPIPTDTATADPSPAPTTRGTVTPTTVSVAVAVKPATTRRDSSRGKAVSAPHRPPPCFVSLPLRAVRTLVAAGYAWRGHTRVDLALTLSPHGHDWQGNLRVHDPRAGLLLSSSGIRHIVLACASLRVDGLGRIGKKRATAFTVGVWMGQQGLTVTMAIPRLHYRLNTAFHGRLTVRPIRPTPTASKRPSSWAHNTHKKATAPRPPPSHGGKH